MNNNLKFLREQAGLKLKEVAECTGLSFSYISKLERPDDEEQGRLPSLKTIRILARFYAVGEPLIIGEETPFGDVGFYEPSTQATWYVSTGEYLRLKRLGKVAEEITPAKPLTESEIADIKKRHPHSWEEEITIAQLPFIKREAKESTLFAEETIGLADEVATLLQSMNKKQLEKTLLVIKEVILK